MRTSALLADLALLSAAIASPVAQSWTVGQEVQTSSGKVKGGPAERPGYLDVSQYVGIPYAETPEGALRWLPPKPFKSNVTIDGTKWKE
jgi:carboxylesterase type B